MKITRRQIRKIISETAKEYVYTHNTPFDLGCAWRQTQHMVVSPHRPYFYQADERDSANKWEYLTKTPLRIFNDGPEGVRTGAPPDPLGEYR